jgi:glucokinase
MTQLAIGIDVGGTKAAAVLVDGEGDVHRREVVDTPADDVPALLGAMLDVTAAVHTPDVVAIGVGAAGLVEEGTGRVRYAPNIAWREVDLRALLAGFGVPVAIDNDCTVASIGERLVGAGRGIETFLYVGVGTGIGGGIVYRGEAMRGAHGFAGRSVTSSAIPAARGAGVAMSAAGRPWRAAPPSLGWAASGWGPRPTAERWSRRRARETRWRCRYWRTSARGWARASRVWSTCSIPNS